MSQVSEMLEEAKKLIDTPKKWIKGDYEKDGCYCAAGALIAIGSEDVKARTYWKARTILRNIIAGRGPQTAFGPSITRFNDAPETTHADVMRLFDLAIKRSK